MQAVTILGSIAYGKDKKKKRNKIEVFCGIDFVYKQ
jgi:hypothetical protein